MTLFSTFTRHTKGTFRSELRTVSVDPSAMSGASAIVADVRTRGVDAILEHAVRLGDLPDASSKWIFSREDLKKSFDALDEKRKSLLTRATERVTTFAVAQRSALTDFDSSSLGNGNDVASSFGKGYAAGHRCDAVEYAGCYAPGGRYPLPSSVIMTVATARAAGVKQVWAASPRPTEVTLAAAFAAGADGLIAIGGAQAIACLAYGSSSSQSSQSLNKNDGSSIPKCDVVVGPGNKWVTAAKACVSGDVGIDMLAGPSEVLVIADETADPGDVAADLIAQAEHDTDARAILVTPVESVVADVERALKEQLGDLPTRETAETALSASYAVVVDSIDDAIEVSDVVAPEHLQLIVKDADKIAARVNNYGGLFIGGDSAEVLGDYAFGPNHTLPTVGTARYTGGLSVFTFIRIRTWLRVDSRDQAKEAIQDAVDLALEEGLHGHSRAAARRLPKQ